MTKTYRDDINIQVDNSGIYSTRKKEGLIRLDRGFYITRDLISKLRFEGGAPIEEFHSSSMERFVDIAGISRQAVRDSIIVNGKFIFLRKGYYSTDGLIVFLYNFLEQKNEK